MEQWYIAAKRADFRALAKELGVSPVLVRLMRNRGLTTAEEMARYLHGSLADLPDPRLLKNVEAGAAILKKKIEEGKRIRIISDYDVDGVSSNYILYRGLSRLSAKVDYRIPDRITDGYGINERLIAEAAADGIDTILTCDNGIAAAKEIAGGKERGLTFVVTDHHDVPYTENADGTRAYRLPPADVVINPKQPDCPYPNKEICGAVVAWKLLAVLYEACGLPAGETEEFLEMAALATVCDVMPLQGENRILVKEGLARMRRTKNRGLAALLSESQIDRNALSAYHLGFVIGPCINASGRLSTADQAMELLLCEDETACREKAAALKALNEERKARTARGVTEAQEYLEKSGRGADDVLVVYLKDCHESIAGIIAGRIREAWNKPTFLLTKGKDGIKGSGRSIEGYHMFGELCKIPECFEKFGGHPMAAGLTLRGDCVEEFRRKLNENSRLTPEDFVKKVHIDVAVPVGYLSEDFVRELSLLEPFGTGNEKPLFAQRNLKINGLRVLGQSGRALKLFLEDGDGVRIEGMYFGETETFFQKIEEGCGRQEADRLRRGLRADVCIDCTYYPQIDEWRGRRTLRIVLKNVRCRRGGENIVKG